MRDTKNDKKLDKHFGISLIFAHRAEDDRPVVARDDDGRWSYTDPLHPEANATGSGFFDMWYAAAENECAEAKRMAPPSP